MVSGALTGLGVSKVDADYYDEEFRGGRTLVTVDADDRRAEAEEIMRGHGAYDAANRRAGEPDTRRLTTGPEARSSGPSPWSPPSRHQALGRNVADTVTTKRLKQTDGAEPTAAAWG